MLFKLLLLMTIVPISELFTLLKVHDFIAIHYGKDLATSMSLGTIMLTGILGANLARYQGMRVVKEIKANLASGTMPAEQMLSGVMILLGGGLLLTPGYLTDILGFMLILPITRIPFARAIKSWFADQIKKGNFSVQGQGFPGGGSTGFYYSDTQSTHSNPKYHDAIDVEAKDIKD